MDLIQLLQILINFGLVVLIWVVQLIIYPSFLYYSDKNLKKWHQKYTVRLSIVVMPLMLGQLVISSFQLLNNTSIYSIIITISIYIIWAITFLFAVPLHNGINKSNNAQAIASNLIKINWLRTFLWTLIFMLDLAQNIFSQP